MERGESVARLVLKKDSCIFRNESNPFYAGVLFALCTTAEGGGINHKRSCPNGRS
jgi:hypothetical protein